MASDPLVVKRTFSAQGTASTMSSARRMMGSLVAKKVEPWARCSWTALTTAGCAWPRAMGPEPRRKSMYSLPVRSQMWAPWALAMMKARSGGV